jgi:uncharacterized protein YbaR (Trm112 family)
MIKECLICTNNSSHFKGCNRCKHDWCNNCNVKIFSCPYCRKPLSLPEEEMLRAYPGLPRHIEEEYPPLSDSKLFIVIILVLLYIQYIRYCIIYIISRNE